MQITFFITSCGLCSYTNHVDVVFRSFIVFFDAASSAWNIIALCDDCSCRTTVRALVVKINDLHFLKTTYIYKDFTERNYIMRNICVRDAPCWDLTPNVLNSSSTNCNCTRTERRNVYKGVPKLTQDLNLPPFVQRSVGNPERKRISQLTA